MTVSYSELHCLTNYSFLRGASHPHELVQRASELGYAALAITDLHSLAGVVRAHVAARETGLKLLIGAEIRLPAVRLVLLATDRAAYGRLARLLTLGKRRAPKGDCQLTADDIAAHAQGLLLILLPIDSSDPTTRDPAGSPAGGQQPALIDGLTSAFADRCYVSVALHRSSNDAALLDRQAAVARQLRLPLVATGNVHYHMPERRPLHDCLTAVRLGCTVDEIGPQRFANGERYLRPRDELAALFATCPDALARTQELADRCSFSLAELRYEYPEELCPVGTTVSEYLAQLTWRGTHDRYPAGVPDRVRQLLEHELGLIAELRYEAYFLTVWDLVRFARSRGILCQGRGSAANSAVCYCLGVTAVDPSRIDVLFERFISRERNEAPDIDVDFEHERREEVLQYLYAKYGRERAGLTAEVISYRWRSAVRDVGKALGLELPVVDRLAKSWDRRSSTETWPQRFAQAGLDPGSRVARQLPELVDALYGFPRHLSQHVGGMVMTRGPLCELVPIENAAMPDRTVIEWDKDDLDALGILKVDCLALGMLTAIRKCFELIRSNYGHELTLATIPAEDARVYDMVSRADTVGVFQIESRAQMSMLPRLRPSCFYDLVVEVAIVRPGPIQGQMVHPYLRRRAGLEPVEYPNDAIRAVLDKTLGVPIFQEQAMRLAVVAAGFTPGEADQLRRAMGAWRRSGVIEKFRQKLLVGMTDRGLSQEFAERVYQQLCGFGEYGFPESHAASFALLVYVSAWLKCYYPEAFCAALINSQPMGFYAPAQLVRDAREHEVEIVPVDVNHSANDCLLEAGCERSSESPALSTTPDGQPRRAVRLGFCLLSGLPTKAIEAIMRARHAGRFTSLDDFTRRVGLAGPWLVRLARAQAFGSLRVARRQALWQSLGEKADRSRPLFDAQVDDPTWSSVELPELSPLGEVLADYRTAGLSLRGHPLAFIRAVLDQRRVVRSVALRKLPVGTVVRVAGLVLVRQQPSTARGIIFVTLEDETGVANLIVRPEVWERYRQVARHATAWIARGRLERKGRVIHVLATRLEDLAVLSGDIGSQSRDFH